MDVDQAEKPKKRKGRDDMDVDEDEDRDDGMGKKKKKKKGKGKQVSTGERDVEMEPPVAENNVGGVGEGGPFSGPGWYRGPGLTGYGEGAGDDVENIFRSPMARGMQFVAAQSK